jgi:hypothetical protein
MFRTTQRSVAGLFCLALLLSGTACATREADESATTEPATQAPAPTAQVTEVILGRDLDTDNRVTVQTDQFKANDVVYVTVLTSGSSPNSTLRAVWTDANGQVVDESQQVIASTGVTEFHVSKPEGLPAGRYQVEIFLDGNSVQTKEFVVT